MWHYGFQVEANREAFERAPDSLLDRLVELLAVPNQGCDALLPQDGLPPQDWLEYHCRVLHPSAGGVDPEVRVDA